MSLVSRDGHLGLQTTTATCVSRAQVTSTHGTGSPTSAETQPPCPLDRLARQHTHDGQTAEQLAGEIINAAATPARTSILCLRLPSRPAAILWRVITSIVLTFQRQPSWAGSHVSEEGFVRVSPAITDSDASASVVDIVGPLRVVAACLHIAPRAIGWRDHPSTSGAVLPVPMGHSGTIA